MMIALPNADCSWTVTLFMPHSDFAALDTEKALIDFFNKYFPDALRLIGRDRLIKDFFAMKPSTLVSIKVAHLLTHFLHKVWLFVYK